MALALIISSFFCPFMLPSPPSTRLFTSHAIPSSSIPLSSFPVDVYDRRSVWLHILLLCLHSRNAGQIDGRALDTIILVFVGIAWIVSFRATRNTTITAVSEFDIDNWFRFRFAGGCVFLLSWQLRSTLVFLKRVETEEKKELTIQTEVLHAERQVALKLLNAMVPPRIASELCRGVVVAPELHPFSTVFFSDIEGFTRFSSVKSPVEVFAMLNRLFRVMDYCVTLFPSHLYKLETIGDGYVVVGGLPPADGSRAGSVSDDNGTERDSAEEEARWRQEVTLATCQFALLIREAVQMVPLDEVSFVKVRIGIHTGTIVTGINGTVVPRFSVFGDSVNVAARMETTGETNRVHVSGAFADLLNRAQRGAPEFTLQTRDPVEVKGKGRMQTFWLDVPDLDDFRLKRAATLAFIDKLLLNSAGSHAHSGPRFLLFYLLVVPRNFLL